MIPSLVGCYLSLSSGMYSHTSHTPLCVYYHRKEKAMLIRTLTLLPVSYSLNWRGCKSTNREDLPLVFYYSAHDAVYLTACRRARLLGSALEIFCTTNEHPTSVQFDEGALTWNRHATLRARNKKSIVCISFK